MQPPVDDLPVYNGPKYELNQPGATRPDHHVKLDFME